MSPDKYLKSKLKSLNMDQRKLYNDMQSSNLLQICIPTGAGKGYIMMSDLLNQVLSTDNNIFAISTHRLMLNNQHLNDIFKMLSPVIGEVGFVFVGSSKYDVNKFQENTEFNKALQKSGLSFNELVGSTTSSKEVDILVKTHIDAGRKVIILTTYHSLDALRNINIDTIYNDEAHTLASVEDGAQFKENFSKITFERCFFFTATPKDCTDEETESFLMSNENIFGKRVGLNFRECVEKGYIVKPIVHIALPSNFDPSIDFKSVENMCKFVKETFLAHKEFIRSKSSDPSKIAPKILVKCSSVADMWKIQARLVGQISGVKICAGASRNDNSNFNHYIDDLGIVDRSEYLEKIQNFGDDEEAIVLHYDTMSEGINVAGFTGTEFLSGKLSTTTKTLQNTGRSTRLHKSDRDRLISGEIAVGGDGWVKPYCAVIIPFWDTQSEFTTRQLAEQIKGLRDNFGYDPHFLVSLGSDIADGEVKVDMDALNNKTSKDKKSQIIEEIRHEIELMDQAEVDSKESQRINNMSVEEWFNYANGI